VTFSLAFWRLSISFKESATFFFRFAAVSLALPAETATRRLRLASLTLATRLSLRRSPEM